MNMKKIKNWVFGGLQQKIFNLVLVTVILIVSAYTAVLIYQGEHIRELVTESTDLQNKAIDEISGQTMDAVVSSSLSGTAQLQAQLADLVFHDAGDAVRILAEQSAILLENPQDYGVHKVQHPDPANEGTAVMQLLSETNVDLLDRKIEAKVGLLGNLKDIMTAICASGKVDSAFIGTSDGIFVIMDEWSADKFNEDGKLKPFPVRQRAWYKGAVEKGGLYFTDLFYDVFSGRVEVCCSMPVYVNGNLEAVVGADLFLDSLQDGDNDDLDKGTFIFAVNQDGHVIYSPDVMGTFAPQVSDRAKDLRKSEHEELAAFISDALKANTDVRLVNIDGKEYYMTGALLPTVGWASIYVVDKADTELQAVRMKESFQRIHDEGLAKLSDSITKSLRMILLLIILIMLSGLGAALTLAKRIVSPLNLITKRISSLSEGNQQFMMADEYRTGDEIEVLAEAFADISAKTIQYIQEVASVTAENQRISTELDMAKSIQESQLPSIFPAFPNRPDFDIYASMSPAREVGGDFYDFFLVDENHLCMVMADVSGKGVPAALFMMISKILIKNRIQNGDTPGQALMNVNNQLQEGGETDIFVTVWLCVLDIRTGRALVSNAGHEHPAIRRKNGTYELVKYRHSPALGMMEGMVFEEHDFQMYPGDTLFVYTDGVPEATNADNELFGTDRMLEALNSDPEAAPQQILVNVHSAVNDFVQMAEQFDDLTMLCLEYKG